MKRLAILLMLVTLVIAGGCGPFRLSKVYKVLQVVPHADIDYDFIKNIDKVQPPYPAGGKYQIGDIKTKPGIDTVFKFIAESKAKTSSGKKEVHDLIIVKADYLSHKILDAYHYTLEWTDQPSLDLYRARHVGMKLRSGLRINEMNFVNKEGRQLIEKAYLCIKRRCRFSNK